MTKRVRTASVIVAILVLMILVVARFELAADAPSPLEKEKSLAQLLPRVPPVEAKDALKTIKVERGFKLELVAAEPLVSDPVDACFDEFGRMYVAEFHGYPYSAEPTKLHPQGGGKKNDGIIRLLADTDGDGRFDKSTIFADQFEWALSVCCYNGGVFVIGHPHLWYFKDTDGDGKADVREIVLTGFGKDNVQSLANNMKWSLENRILVAGGRNPNVLTRGDQVVLQGTSDFSFDPKSNTFEPLSGGEQFGHSLDDWGNRFVCNNSNHIEHVVFPRRYLARNSSFVASGTVRSIGFEGAAAVVFRRSPPEPWRIVRTARRVADPKFSGLPQSERVPIGFFTSATGVTIYRGSAYPEEFRGNAFIGDVGANLIHRKTLTPNGASFGAKRADENTEFITSTDNWFRPVNFVNAPDGTLYVLDMYRETIEHPASIPEDIKAHLDLESGNDRGRIWRIVSPDGKRLKVLNLGKMTSAELVAQLESANAWNRETAQRLLWERQDTSIVPQLEKLAHESSSPLGRLHALCTLEGLTSLRAEVLMPNLSHVEPRLRSQTIRLAEPLLANNRELANAVQTRVTDDDEKVRVQLAFTVGEMPDELALTTLLQLAQDARNGGDVRVAMMTSLAGRVTPFFQQLASDAEFAKQPHANSWFVELARTLGSDSNAAAGLSALRTAVASSLPAATRSAVLTALGEGLRRRGGSIPKLLNDGKADDATKSQVVVFFKTAVAVAANSKSSAGDRIAAARMLGLSDFAMASETLGGLLQPQIDPQLQIAAANSLGQLDGTDVPKLLLTGWRSHSPAVRREIVDALLRSGNRVDSLLEAVQAGTVLRGEIERDKKDLLLNHPQSDIRDRARQLLAAEVDPNRAKVVAEYQSAAAQLGDAARGKVVFQQKCANCHQIGDVGFVVGPNLQSVANKSPADLLLAILDPSREAQPNFTTYVVETTDGKVLNGLLAAESANSVTLRRVEAKEDVVLRSNIETIASNGKSLMPEGFEKEIPATAMADLLAFLKSLSGQ